jgi:hypothetical protein
MTVKSLEQRIIERAQNELRERISYMVAGLRNQLEGDEGRIAVKLEASDGLFPIDDLLDVVERELVRATQIRHCDKALDSALASLESDLAYRNQYGQPQQRGVPQAPAAEPWKQ